MQDSIRRNLLFSVWMIAILSLAALFLTREIGITRVLFTVLLLPFVFYGEWKNRLTKIRWFENSFILCLFFLSLFRLFFLKNSFLIVLADFLILFIFLKLVFKKERKDLLQIIALSFFILLSASTLAQDFTFLFSCALYALAAAWTLCLYTLDEQSQEKEEDEPKKIFRSLFRNCQLTLGCSLFFAFAIFVFFPRLSLVVFQGAFLGPVHKAGFSEKINLIQSGKIFEDPTVVMRVEIDPERRKQMRRLYLRGETLSYFDGTEWTGGVKRAKLSVKDSYRSKILKMQRVVKNQFQLLDLDKNLLRKEFQMKADQNSTLRQKIVLSSLESSFLFGAPWMESLSAPLPQVSIFEDYSVARPANFAGRIAYEVDSLVERPSERALLKQERAPATPPVTRKSKEKYADEESRANLQLPELDLTQVHALVKKIVSTRDPAYIKAKKIERYLRKNYSYTLEAGAAESPDPVGEFLFKTKRGHCEQFAAAMAVMLRIAGVPARIATGFLAGEWNPSGNYFIVKNKDAHAWVESYLGRGLWLDFDPSPRNPALESEKFALWSEISQKIDYLNYLWYLYILSYDMESQKSLAKNVELKSSMLSQSLDKIAGKWKIALARKSWIGEKWSKIWKLAAGRGVGEETENKEALKRTILNLIFLIFLTIIAFVTARRRKNLINYFKKFSGRKTIGSGTHFYLEMLKILSKRGAQKKESETPYEFAERFCAVKKLKDSTPAKEIHQSIILITNLFYKIRFSNLPPTNYELLTMKQSLQNLRNLMATPQSLL